MSAELKQAQKAVAEARRAIHETLIHLPGWDADAAREQLDRMERAIRRHDAELVRAYRDSLPFDGEAAAAMSLAATHIDPKGQR